MQGITGLRLNNQLNECFNRSMPRVFEGRGRLHNQTNSKCIQFIPNDKV